VAVRARRGPPPPLCAGTAARRRAWATAQSERDVIAAKAAGGTAVHVSSGHGRIPSAWPYAWV